MTEHVVKDHKLTVEELMEEQEAMHEKAERKRLESFWWAAVITWAGIIFLVDYLEVLPQIREAGAWSWIFLGAGVFGFVGALIRTFSANLPQPTSWDVIWSAVFLIIGATGFFGEGIAFPIALVIVGVVILASTLFRND